MTQAGPAIPVIVVTDRYADAGPALRVAVVSDGRPIEAGPARPVIVVTDGRPTQGNEPLPIVVATGVQAGRILAGPAIPVVVVSGTLGGVAPVNTALPVISGALGVGQLLSTTNGTWTNIPTSYTYQWKRNGVAIGGATNSTYTTVTADGGTTITVTVTATNAAGSASATSAGVLIDPFLDSFSDTKAAGAVIGSNSPSGNLRRGTDTESILSVSDGRLRIPGPVTAGWNRAGDGYGSYARANGLAFVAFFQDGDVQNNVGGVAQHLAIGWFSSATPANALTDGNAIVIAENGTAAGKIERNGSAEVNIVSTFKQLPLYVLVILRSTGAIYYVGSVTGAFALPAYPLLRPLGIDAVKTDATVYAAIWQRSILAMQSNIYAVNVSQVVAWSNWYTAAHLADLMTGSGALAGSAAAIGGTWAARDNGMTRGGSGAVGTAAAENILYVLAPQAAGMVVAQFTTGASPDICGLMIRYKDTNNWHRFWMDATRTVYDTLIGGAYTLVAQSGAWVAASNATFTLSVIDDGSRLRFYRDQVELLLADGFSSTSLASEVGSGIDSKGTQTIVKNFEAHPRTITLPAVLDLGSPYMTVGATSVATEDFAGVRANLAGKVTTTGALTWQQDGAGVISTAGTGLIVTGGGSKLYTLPWSSPAFADITVSVIPPGVAYGTGAVGRCGPLFWQDSNNWIAIRTFADDGQVNSAEYEVVGTLAGVSLSVQQRVNVGTGIFPGVSAITRISCNGDAFYTTLNGVAMLVWSLKDKSTSYSTLTINRIGIYADAVDNGSQVDDFTARSL